MLLRFSVDKPLFTDPIVELESGISFTLLNTDGLSFEYALTSDERMAEGTSAVRCSLVDSSGNIATNIGLGSLVFDYTPPQLSRMMLSETLLSAGKTLQVDLTVNESLSREPSVTLDDGQTFAVVATPPLFEATHLVTSADQEGEHTVSVELSDLAGNTASATGLIEVDLTPPTIVSVTSLASPATVGSVAGIVLTTSEPLLVKPEGVLRAAGAIDLLSQATTSTVFSLTHTVDPSDEDGTYFVELAPIFDLAGNRLTTTSLAEVAIDTNAPLFSSPPSTGTTTRFSAKSGHDHILLTFAVNESVDVDVSLGSTPLDDCTPGLAANSFECQYTVTGIEPEGIVAIGVTVTDAAGNRRFGSTLVDLDFTPPSIFPGSVVQTLTPPIASVLPIVDALSVGAVTAISMLFSEPLESLSARTETPAVLPMQTVGLATSWSISLSLSAGSYIENSPHEVQVTATDLLGNDATIDLGPTASFSIDVSAPTAPDTLSRDPARIVYRRIPWGSDATLGTKRFTLTGASGAVEPNTVVVAYEDAMLTNEIGRSLPSALDGSFAEFALNPIDRAHVWIVQVDSAANASVGQLVRHVEWTATMNGKVAGSSVPNPNTFLGVQRNIGGLSPKAPQRVGDLGGIGSVGGGLFVNQTGTEWNFVTNTQAAANARPPIQMALASAAWDDGSNRLVRFGGYRNIDSTCTSCSDAAASCGAPCVLCGAFQMIDGQKACVMGRTQVASISTIGPPTEYEWSILPPGTSPQARFAMAMGYDALRDETILFGGRDPSASCTPKMGEHCGDTWRLSGNVWTKLAPAGPQPSPRSGASMVYDTARSRFILFGGYDPTRACTLGLSNYCDDTWEWTGSAWSKVLTTGPSGRELYGFAYDMGRDRAVLFGGRTSIGGCPGAAASDENDASLGWLCNDTWELVGGIWSPITGTAPTPRFQVSLAYDLARGHTVMAGGSAQAPCDGGGWAACAGIFALNGDNWEALNVSDTAANGEPSPFAASSLVFERVSSYLLLTGGRRVNFAGELWSLDGGGAARPRHIFQAELERAFDTGPLELVKQVNFQPSFSPPPTGYLIDTGQPFGSRGGGENYGWNVDASSDARDRNDPDSLDERYDTFNHIAKPDGANATLWEIEVSNGSYLVHAVCGDADFGGSCDLCVEGSSVVKGSHAPGQWREDQAFIDVTDGRLSLTSCLSGETKINYLEIRRLDLRSVSVKWRGGVDSASYSPTSFVNLVGGGPQPAALNTTFAGVTGISGPAKRIWTVELVSQTSGILNSWCLYPQGVGGAAFCRSPAIAFAANGAVNDTQSLLSESLPDISALALSVNIARSGTGTLQLRLVGSAVGGPTTTDAELMAFNRSSEDFTAVQPFSASSSSPALVEWSSSDAAVIRPLVGRVPLDVSFAIQPTGTSGWGTPAARAASDYVETTVFYSLPQ